MAWGKAQAVGRGGPPGPESRLARPGPGRSGRSASKRRVHLLSPVQPKASCCCRVLPGLILPKVAGKMKEMKMERIKDVSSNTSGSATEAKST